VGLLSAATASLQVPETYVNKGKSLTFVFTPQERVVYFAYAPIYSYEDTLDFFASLSKKVTSTPFEIKTIGTSQQNRPVDMVTIGKQQEK
jgi:hypothetical protein